MATAPSSPPSHMTPHMTEACHRALAELKTLWNSLSSIFLYHKELC